MTTTEVEDIKYVIETCDNCCGKTPGVNRVSYKQFEIKCSVCRKGVESDMLWKAVTLWNQMVRRSGGCK